MTQTEPYEFKVDWFDCHIPHWNRILRPYKKRPIRFLEIGVFEGRATIWLLENILTHPEARHVAVDTFEGGHDHLDRRGRKLLVNLEERFRANIEATGKAAQVTTIRGYSQEALLELNQAKGLPFDVIYIDGSHMACDVLADAVLSWPLLKKGGLLIFDDYKWGLYPQPHKTPKAAIDAFLTCYTPQLKVVHHAYQVAVRKK